MRVPFFVLGVQVTEDTMDEIATWCQGNVIRENTDRPFVRVPVDRTIHRRQTEAYVGHWVTMSIQGSEKSFKVFTNDYLNRQFFKLPDDGLDQFVTAHSSGQVCDHQVPPAANNVRSLPTQQVPKPTIFRAVT